jgi:hypothetical protein
MQFIAIIDKTEAPPSGGGQEPLIKAPVGRQQCDAPKVL